MARILILSLVFPPDGVSTAQLMGELAIDLVRGGHSVSVITTQPHFNRDLLAEQAQPLRSKWGGFLFESVFAGIPVLHTVMPTTRRGLVGRLSGWLSFHLLGLMAGLAGRHRADVIIVPSPLLTAGVVAWLITRLRGGSYVYNVQELYPDVAIKMGRLRNPFLIRCLHWLEQFVYRHAAAVTGISEGICNRVSEREPLQPEIHCIPNFVDLRELAPLPKDNGFAREMGLQDCITVSYAGNMGYAQGLEVLLDAAELCPNDRIRFLLVGGGVLYDHISTEISRRSLRNVILLEHQPYARIPEIYAASDICVVPLLQDLDGSALPSKVFRIMACERAILGLCKPDSELAQMIEDSGAGIVVPPGDTALLLNAIQKMANDEGLRSEMGHSGRRFVSDKYERSVVTRRYTDLVTRLSESQAA